MRKVTIVSILGLAAVLGFSPAALAQGSEVVISIDDFERPGRRYSHKPLARDGKRVLDA